ncbi:UNVERIFIED_CONTAM: hypothetical protein NCL1_32353 [Trichonephila clavipes]
MLSCNSTSVTFHIFKWETKAMDNIHTLDPRKQELLEARFIGNRGLVNFNIHAQQLPLQLQQQIVQQNSPMMTLPGNLPLPAQSTNLGINHASSGTSSNSNINHNPDSNLSAASYGSQPSDKELDVSALYDHSEFARCVEYLLITKILGIIKVHEIFLVFIDINMKHMYSTVPIIRTISDRPLFGFRDCSD